MARMTMMREGIGPGRDRTPLELLVCYPSQQFLPAPYTDGGSVLNVDDGHRQGGQGRNPSRAFVHLITS